MFSARYGGCVTDDIATIPSEWGGFTRGSTTLTDGEVLVHDWFVADGTPEIMLRTANAAEAARLLPQLAVFFRDQAAWHRRATDAVVTQFSEDAPEQAELDEAETDLVLATVEAYPGGDVVLHFDDLCGEHLPEGYWPAVRFDGSGAVSAVTVEA